MTDQRLQAQGMEIKNYKSTGNGIFKDEYKRNILARLR